jgi:protein-S-isoprenylcysteine O-methyltransferase Ste14
MDPLELLLLVVLSGLAVAASMHAWRTHQTYGYFRFLAFESLAALIVSNVGHWFHEPLSLRQILSWMILAGSTVLAIHGVKLLRSVGRARSRVMEDTQTVVQTGVYRYIRHPLYASLLFFGWGVFCKGLDLLSFLLALTATTFLIVTARYEERFNIAYFGSAYAEYMKRTKMFVPLLL